MSAPYFYKTPFRYLKWAALEKPALFWGTVIGVSGFPLIPVVPRLRAYYGDGPREKLPMTYPMPKGDRKQLSGYED